MSLNVVFLGTPEFAVASLDAIHKSDHHVSLVVTNPDKPAGRGQVLSESPVKKYAQENNLSVFQPENLKDVVFLEEMKYLQPDIMVVVAFKILPKELYEIPKYGTFNLHASLLPELRGAAPINFAIINGLEQTGVTTFYINEKVDTGNILMQRNVDIQPDETAGSLHDKLMETGKDLVVRTLDGISDFSLHTKPQDESRISYAPKIDSLFREIVWDDTLENIDRKVRGLSPYPSALTYIEVDGSEKLLKIINGKIQFTNQNYTPKSIVIEDGLLKIAHKEGFYIPTELQLEGKKRMKNEDFVNGLQNKENIRVK